MGHSGLGLYWLSVTEWKENLYLESRQKLAGDDKYKSNLLKNINNWVQVEDLTELKVWEYNKLVDELNKHYPEYPIERLESRFV